MAEVVEVEENSTQKMRTVRIPPVLTVNKTASYAVYELTYIRVWEFPFYCKLFALFFLFLVNLSNTKVYSDSTWKNYLFVALNTRMFLINLKSSMWKHVNVSQMPVQILWKSVRGKWHLTFFILSSHSFHKIEKMSQIKAVVVLLLLYSFLMLMNL